MPKPRDACPATRAASQIVKNTVFIGVTLTHHSSPVGINRPAELERLERASRYYEQPQTFWTTLQIPLKLEVIAQQHMKYIAKIGILTTNTKFWEEKASHESPPPRFPPLVTSNIYSCSHLQ